MGPGVMDRKVDRWILHLFPGGKAPYKQPPFFVVPTVHPSRESGLCPWPLPLPLPTRLLWGKPLRGYVTAVRARQAFYRLGLLEEGIWARQAGARHWVVSSQAERSRRGRQDLV